MVLFVVSLGNSSKDFEPRKEKWPTWDWD